MVLSFDSHHVICEHANLHYTLKGKGKKAVLVFHGYGQKVDEFLTLFDGWSSDHRIYMFDLFYHGQSHWYNKSETLDKRSWKGLMELFFDKEKIGSVALVGFSMGAKLAYLTVDLFPDKVHSVYFIAPDGLVFNFWYYFATHRGPVNSLFRYTVTKPYIYGRILFHMRNLCLAGRYMAALANDQMRTRSQRLILFRCWMLFKNIHISMKRLSAVHTSDATSFTFILGKKDRVIPSAKVIRALKSFKNVEVLVLDYGHKVVFSKALHLLKEELQ